MTDADGLTELSQEEMTGRIQEHVRNLTRDDGFESERFQIRSKAILSELSPESVAGIEYRYSAVRVVRNAELLLLAMEKRLPGIQVSDETRRVAAAVAETYEHLSALGEGIERNSGLLRASLLYELAGYQANSAYLAREALLPALRDDDPAGFPGDLLTRWTLLLLRRNAVLLFQETREPGIDWDRMQSSLVSRIEAGEENIDGLMALGEARQLAEAFSGIAAFCLRGDGERLETALGTLDRLLLMYRESGEATKASVGSGVRAAAQSIRDRSTWTNLNGDRLTASPLWQRYLQLLARGQGGDLRQARGVFELWPSQLEAVGGGLLDEEQSFVVQMPTSAGKTRIAEILILDTFVRHRDAKCVYVAPYRALADQVERDLGSTFGDLGFRVSSVLGSFELDDFQDFMLRETDLLVTTPEKLDLLYRVQPEFFDNVYLLVLDEGQLVDDDTRGARYELLITKLRRKFRDRGMRILFLSAVMAEDNLQDFATWLTDRPDRAVRSEWRPTRQLLGQFTWRGTNGELRYGERGPFVPNLCSPKEYIDFTPKLRREKTVTFPDPASKGETAAELAIKFAEHGSVLVFTTLPIWVDSLAAAVMRGLKLRRQTGAPVPEAFETGRQTASVEAASEWLGGDHPVTRALREGIAVHYGPLPEAVRRTIEADYRAGRYPVMIATNTLAQGVNLPIKTAIVHSTTRGAESEEREWQPELLPVRDFWNICGRAGRAGVETEGQIVYVVASPRDVRLYDYYSDVANIEPIKGRLYKILAEIVEDRISPEEFAEALDSEILSILVEEIADTPHRGVIEEVLGSSLVRVQAAKDNLPLDGLVERTVELADQIWESVPDDDVRRLFAKTGLGVASCQAILNHVTENATRIRELIGRDGRPLADLVDLLVEGCGGLREMQPRYPFDAPVHQMLNEWVAGVPFGELLESYADNDREAQRLTRFIEDYFAYRLPWGFSAYLRVAIHKLEYDNESLPDDVKYFPSMVKFGVDNKHACWAMSLGIPSRDSAPLFAAAYREDAEDSDSFTDFMEWLSSLSEEDLAERFDLSHHKLQTIASKIAAIAPRREEFRELLRIPNEIDGNVVGLLYEGRLNVALRLRDRQTLELRRDYGNPYDRNAIKVIYEGDELGFVERRVARLIAPEIDAGVRYTAVVLERHLAARPPRVKIRLTADVGEDSPT